MLIAQISDLHISESPQFLHGRVDPGAYLQRAVAQLNQLSPQPDMVIATGDLVEAGTEAEYQQLRSHLAPLTMPVYLAVGNHDNRQALRQVFTDHHYLVRSPATAGDNGYLHYLIDAAPLRLIVLDTLVPGHSYGDLDPPRLSWLEARLREAPQMPTIIFMHHPPFATGLATMDRSACRHGDALAQVITQFPQVERVACGHLHRPIQRRWAGTVASVAPSVAHQINLTLEPAQPLALTLEPPAFYLHQWLPNSGVVTHTVYIGPFPTYTYKTGEPLRPG